MIPFNDTTEYDALRYPELKASGLACQNCALAKTRTQVVFGSGPVPCDIMIVGEGPGAKEDEQGQPFVGRSGQLLTKIFLRERTYL